jgi:hypothetical protein
VASNAGAQQNYQIKYNVLSGKHEIFRENGTNSLEPASRVRFHDGDVVRVTVDGYNPLKHFVVIRQNDVKTLPTADPKFLEEAKNFLGKSQGIFSFLKDVDLPFLGSGIKDAVDNTRSAEYSNKLFENVINYNNYDVYRKKTMEDLSGINKDLETFNTLIAEAKDKTTCTKAKFTDIQTKLKGIREHLSEVSYQTIASNFQEAQKQFALAKFKYGDNTNVTADQGLVEAQMEILNSYNQLVNSWSKMNEVTAIPNSLITVEKIDALIYQFENLKFETEQIYMIHTGSTTASFTGASGSSSGVITDMDFSIDVFDVDKVLESTKKDQKLKRYVKYPNPGRYWTTDNKPTQTPCSTCKPMIKAEGVIEGDVLPENYAELFNNEGELIKECVGKWIIYDDNGNIKTIKYPPSVLVLNGNAPGESGMATFNNENLPENTITTKKNIRLPVAGAFSVNWTTGLVGVGAFKGRNTYTTRTVGLNQDSLSVVKKDATPLNVCLASVMSIDFLSGRVLVPGINLGVAVDLSSGRNLNYLLGFSVRPKKFPLFSLTGGMAYTPVNILNTDISETRTYKQTEFYNTLGQGSLNVQKYQLGYYFGLHINL